MSGIPQNKKHLKANISKEIFQFCTLTLRKSPKIYRNDPQKVPRFMMNSVKIHNSIIPPKIFIFLKTPKNIEIQNFEPPKWSKLSVTSHINCIVARCLINVVYLTACCLYQVMMTLHFLNGVANDAESTQKSKITS